MNCQKITSFEIAEEKPSCTRCTDRFIKILITTNENKKEEMYLPNHFEFSRLLSEKQKHGQVCMQIKR
jgi:hypothetical protein